MSNPITPAMNTLSLAPIPYEGRAEFQPAEPILSQAKLHIDDDYGSETYIKTIFTETLLGLRNALRELNPGTIPIYSDHDCTGLVCGQWCKFIKIYKSGRGYIGVVEITVSRDV